MNHALFYEAAEKAAEYAATNYGGAELTTEIDRTLADA